MTALPHQIEKAAEVYNVLKQYGICYLQGEVRSGKTYTSILALEHSPKVKKVLVLTKKAAIAGFEKFTKLSKIEFTVINYEQVNKLQGSFDACILDEAHNLGTLGKPSERVKDIRKVCLNLPTILLSGTAMVESPCSIYHQCCITKYSPFKHKNFYDFHREFGVPQKIFIGGRQLVQYKGFQPKLLTFFRPYTVTMSQIDAGITVNNVHRLHYVQLEETTKALYNKIEKDNIVTIQGKDLVCDSTMKLRTSLHMVESGIVKIDSDYIKLGNLEKIKYLKENFSLNKDTVILAHYIGEQALLKEHFPLCTVGSATAQAEGVSFAHAKEFILFSSGYSGAKFIQRIDRITDINGSSTNIVHHILVKNAISEQVYAQVSSKKDFNNLTYKKGILV